jgi:hypothetical protein
MAVIVERQAHRLDWQEFFRLRRVEMLWIWKVFGPAVSFGSGQIANYAPDFLLDKF